MLRTVGCIVILVCMSRLVQASEGNPEGSEFVGPRVFLMDPGAIAEIKERVAAGDKSLAPAVKKLREDADKALNAGPFSVTFKEAVPPSGDKHDYMSMGTYWWPNPDTPDGLPYVRRDGEVNPEGDKLDSTPLSRMVSAVNTLSLAYYLTDHEPYAAHAARLLRVWFLDRGTRMNPHLEYGQGIPGRMDGRGIGIIDTTGFANVVDSVGLLEKSRSWTALDQARLRTWFRKYLKWLSESKHGKDEEKHPNNHGTWFDVQTSAMALYVGDQATARRLLSRSAERRIAAQIEPDGRQPHELARTRSLSYSLYNLNGMFNIARLAEHLGMDLWNYETEDGRSIRKALDWLVPYARGEKDWENQQIVKVSGQSWVNPLRKAAIKYNDPSYESCLEGLKGVDIRANRINLLFPKSERD